MGAQIRTFWILSIISFQVFPHHVFDSFKCFVSIILASFLASFSWFVMICANIVLKLADLCKCTRRPHGSMTFDVLAPRILMICSWFSDYSPCYFSLNFGVDSGRYLGSFLAQLNFGSFWRSKGRQNVNNNRCENWHRKKWVPRTRESKRQWRKWWPGGGVKGVVNRNEEKKKWRKEEGKKERKED